MSAWVRATVMDGLPPLQQKYCAPRSSRPLIRSSGSVRSMMGESGPSVPKPPGKPSQADILEPMRKFGSLISLLDALVQVKGKLAPVFPRAAVLPLAVVVGAQDLGAQVAVAELHVDAVRAGVIGDARRKDKLVHDMVDFFFAVSNVAAVAVEGLHRDPA